MRYEIIHDAIPIVFVSIFDQMKLTITFSIRHRHMLCSLSVNS